MVISSLVSIAELEERNRPERIVSFRSGNNFLERIDRGGIPAAGPFQLPQFKPGRGRSRGILICREDGGEGFPRVVEEARGCLQFSEGKQGSRLDFGRRLALANSPGFLFGEVQLPFLGVQLAHGEARGKDALARGIILNDRTKGLFCAFPLSQFPVELCGLEKGLRNESALGVEDLDALERGGRLAVVVQGAERLSDVKPGLGSLWMVDIGEREVLEGDARLVELLELHLGQTQVKPGLDR